MTALAATPREITRKEFHDISELLSAHTGIRLVPGKEPLVMGRLGKRVRELDLGSYGEYIQILRSHGDDAELRLAIDLLTTNETYFFREERHFDYLRDVVLAEHRTASPNRPFRLWSAASSSGEEAYTAAMVIAEELADLPWEVVGSDISSRMVRSAQRGVYPISAAERIPRPMLRKYFLKGRDEYDGMMAVSPKLRANVKFVCANLMEDLRQLGTFDVIMLRNVMIYFEAETRIGLISRVQEMLRPGGYLAVSLSETLNGVPSRLRLVGSSVYRLGGDGGG